MSAASKALKNYKTLKNKDTHRFPTTQNILYENRDFAIAKSQFSTNPMLKKGLTHYKE